MLNSPHRRLAIALAIGALAIAGCSSESEGSGVHEDEASLAGASAPATSTYEIVDSFEHSQDSFTQGLEFVADDVLIESSGGYDNPGIMIYEIPSDDVVLEKREVSESTPGGEFGEGLTYVDGEILQLTWQEGTLIRWSCPELDVVGTQSYEGEGWGLCYDDAANTLWRSDGTSTLYSHDPESFEVITTVSVSDMNGAPLTNINELECVGGEVWANVWFDDVVARIDPTSGRVTSEIDMGDVEQALARDFPDFVPDQNQVLNGIAWNDSTRQLFVTGKEWPVTYVLEFAD